MGKDRKYQDRLEVVLRQLKEDLTIVHVSIEELQDKDYRRALHWSVSSIWRKADRHLNAILKRLDLTLERLQNATRGRPPEPKHLRFQKTKSGQIYGESLFGWLRRTWKTQWLY